MAQTRSSSSQSSASIFPFLELPTELRLHIYRMALARPKPILLSARAVEEAALKKSHSNDCCASSDDEMLPHLSPHSNRRKRPTPLTNPAWNDEPLVPALLRVSKQIHREARPVLYSDNEFVLHLSTATATLLRLHQKTRSLIKHLQLTIPTHHDILEGFADLVRLGVRYCWGLKSFTIKLPATSNGIPDDANAAPAATSSTTNVYANAFHILRWLPQTCVVRLEGYVSEDIRRVVEENGRLAKKLDDVSYARFVGLSREQYSALLAD